MRSTSMLPGPVERGQPLHGAIGDAGANDVLQSPAALDVGGRGGVDALGEDAVGTPPEDCEFRDLAGRDRVRGQPDDVIAAAKPIVEAGRAL